jgi:signal transduction histidine kinase
MWSSLRSPRLLLPAVFCWALIALREQHLAGLSWPALTSDLVTGIAMAGAGVWILERRPANRCARLLVAAAFLWYLGDFSHSATSWLSHFSFLAVHWFYGLLVWALLAYPTGRVAGRVERGLLAAVTVVLTAQSLSRLLLWVPPDAAGYGTRNPLLPVTDDRWWRAVEDVVAWAFTLLMVAVLVHLCGRWLRRSAPVRRMLAPAVTAATALTVSVAVEYLVGWNQVVPGLGLPIYLLRYWMVTAVAVALGLGLALLRQSRGVVVDAVGELGRGGSPARLAETLARTLGDPRLRLFLWSPSVGRYVDEAGQPAHLPPDGGDRAVTLITSDTVPVAALVHDAALMEDPGLVNGLAAAVRLTIDNEQLQRRIKAQLDDVATSRARLLAEADAQRRRIERDLHDGAQQRLIGVALALKLAEVQVGEKTEEETRRALARAVVDLGEAITELRDLARGIHPAVLSESGLAAALESLADRCPLPVSVSIDLPAELPEVMAATAYFAVAEALTNVTKHSGASSARIGASTSGSTMAITVNDDGRGGASLDGGSGLRGISDRLQAVGGSLRVLSPVGRGTHVEIELPCVSS